MQGTLRSSGATDYIFFPAASIICPAISTVAGIVVLVSFFVGRSLKEGPLSIMILAINIADLIFSITKASTSIVKPIDDIHCKILQAFSQGAIISSVLWGAFFGHALYVVSKYRTSEILSNYMRYYVIFGVFLPAGITLGSTFTDYVVYSPAEGGICIHRVIDGSIDYDTIIFLVLPLGISCFLSIIWYLMAVQKIRSLFSEGSKANLAMLIIYPGITLVCWVPMLVVNVYTLLGYAPSIALVVWARALDQLQGFFDAIVYGGSIGAIRNTCKQTCKRACKPAKKSSLRQPLRLIDTESEGSANGMTESQYIPRKVTNMSLKVTSISTQKERVVTF